MNYWVAPQHPLPQQHPTLSAKDYERNILHPLNNNNTPRHSYNYTIPTQMSSSANEEAQQQHQAQAQQQQAQPLRQSPHYQYQQTLPRIYQSNPNMHLTGHTPLNVVPPLLSATTIHDRSINSGVSDSNSVGSSNSDTNEKSAGNLIPLRVSQPIMNDNQNPAAHPAYASGISNSSPFLYHWRNQGPIPNTSNNIPTTADLSRPYLGQQNKHPQPVYQMQAQPMYQVPFPPNQHQQQHHYDAGNKKPVGKFQYIANALLPAAQSPPNNFNQLPMIRDDLRKSSNESPRGSLTTMNGKNIVNVLNSRGGTNSRLNNGSISDNNMVVHVHGCHLCEKSFKRKSWLKRHLLSHSAQRHYLCPWCLSRHKRKDNLLQHMKLKHSTFLLDELKNHNVNFNWDKSSVNIVEDDSHKKTDGSDSENSNIKSLLNIGVLNKEDVKRVLNKLIDQNNA